MSKTAIGWTDHSINPLRARHRLTNKVGHFCEKLSAGCKHCYSSALQPRLFGLPEFQEQRGDVPLDRFLDVRSLREVARRRAPTRYFWCSMTDMFGHWVADEQIGQCFATMAATPWHTHLVLTKRAERLYHWCTTYQPTPLPNVWVGVSCEDQATAQARIPWLMQTPVALRFLSLEPLLGPIRLEEVWGSGTIGWCIAGGESGPKRRPMEVHWLEAIVDACAREGVPLFVKQGAALRPGQQGEIPDHLWHRKEIPAWPA